MRLGDLVDDYCPRERRLTNHAIVALVGDAIKQTRCTTCDAEHVFKGGKMPLRRVRGADKGLPSEGSNAGGQLVAPVSAAPAEPAPEMAEMREEPAPIVSESSDSSADMSEPPANDDAHPLAANRTLIRATLPRVEGEVPPPRPIPEFTMHRYNARAGNGFRQGRGGWDRGGFGHGNGRDRRNGNGGEPNGNVANGNGHGNNFGGGAPRHGGGGRRRRGKNRPR